MSKNIPFGLLDPYIGQTVRIYWNLHKRVYSIQLKLDGKWKVVRHSDCFVLDNATWQVNAKTRERVRQTKRKEVHAYLVGTLRSHYADNAAEVLNADCLSYNPHKDDGFVWLSDLFNEQRTPAPQKLRTVYGSRRWYGVAHSSLKAYAY